MHSHKKVKKKTVKSLLNQNKQQYLGEECIYQQKELLSDLSQNAAAFTQIQALQPNSREPN